MAATITLEDIVRKTTDLPSIPSAALQVMRHADSNTASAETIAQCLAQDQSLSVRVLRLANSAYYGLTRQVSDLQEAVVVLGMRSVRSLAMVAATYPWMVRQLKGYCLGPRQLWAHSFGTALGAQLVARASGRCHEDHAFTAGLLHDIGKVALSVWLENRMGAICNYAAREDLTFDQAERKILGFDHAEVGKYLADSWNLPAEITAAIRFHHEPDACKPPLPVVDCVHIGSYLTLSMGFGLGGDGLRYTFSQQSLDRIGLTPDRLDALIDAFVEGYETCEGLFEELVAA